MKNVTVSAPGKLMLFGEHAVLYNKPCLVTTVNQRMYVKLEILEEPEFQLDAPDVGMKGYKKLIGMLGKGDISRGARFVEAAVKTFIQSYPRLQGKSTPGVAIITESEFSSQLGFGSSAAVTVCVIKAMSELFDLKLDNKDIFDLSYKTVLDVQAAGSGFDVAASVYGGTLYFMTGGKIIEQLAVDPLPLIVSYSGIKADTIALIKKVKAKSEKRPDFVENIYNEIEKIVEKAKMAVISGNWKEVGQLMNKNQTYLCQLGVSSEKLDKMADSAVEAGAYGAKLSGAGGGDCMIAVAPEDKKSGVIDAIKKSGGQIIEINAGASGVRVDSL